MKFYIYTDGASRGNPGRSASGYLILDQTHRLMLGFEVFDNGIATNNEAEYRGIIAGLKKAFQLRGSASEIVLTSDSSLVVNQLSGIYKVRSKKLKSLNGEAQSLLGQFTKYELVNVSRENKYIAIVDKELNLFLDHKK